MKADRPAGSRWMQWFHNRPLQTKLIFGISLLSLLVLLASFVSTALFEGLRLRDRLVESFQTTALLLSTNLETSVVFEDSADAAAVLKSLQAYPSITYACVHLRDGRELADYGQLQEKSHRAVSLVESVDVDGFEIAVTQPIYSSGEAVAVLFVRGQMDAFIHYIGFKSLLILITLIIALGMIVLLARRLSSWATGPVLKLAQTAQRISTEGDFSLRQEVTSTDETGQLVSAFNRMMDDIESQNRIIQESERRFRSYFELGVVGMALLDDKLCICESNDRLCQIIGCGEEGCLQADLTTRLSGESMETVRNLSRISKGELSQYQGECWLTSYDDRSIFAMVSARRISDVTEPGKPCIILLIQDITDRKRYEEMLLDAKERAESSNRAKDEFLSVVSHELRTPLNPVIGYAELLEMEIENEELKSSIGYIRESAGHLLQIIDTILDYTRIDRGIEELSYSSFNYEWLLEECMALIKSTAADKEIEFSIEHSVEPPEKRTDALTLVESDKTKLRQIVLNLLSNAVKFTEKGFIRVRSKLDVSNAGQIFLTVEVEDTGIGIETDKLHSIFEPFQQGDLSLKRKYGGLGLGLAICKKMAGLLGGTISCSSIPGKGSLFSFWVPVVHGHHENEDNREDGIHDDAGEEDSEVDKILVVDDDYMNRKIATSMLRRLGFRVDVADNGERGVELAVRNSYKLILMDLQMPMMNGFEASRLIREKQIGLPTPIVAVTAHVTNLSEDDFEDSGMNGFLGKPFSFRQIRETIQKLSA